MAEIQITNPSGGTVSTGVLQIQGGGPITNSSQVITDQLGNTSPLYISSTALTITTPTSASAITRVVIQGSTDSAGYILRATNRTGNEMFNIKDDGSVLSAGPLTVSTIANATTDTDKFLVSDNGTLKYRTGAEVLSDIGAQSIITNPVTGTGTATRVAFWSSGSAISSSSALNWDNTNGRLGIGVASPSARLQVTGDGIANTVRFESSTSTNLFTLSDQGLITAFAPATTALTGTTEIIKSTSSFIAPSAGSGSFRPFSIAYTINNTGAQTGTATGIFLNATETVLGGMTHNLMDIQVGGASALKTSSLGSTSFGINKVFTSAVSYFSTLMVNTINQTVAANSLSVGGVFSDILFSGSTSITAGSATFSRATITNTSASNSIKGGLFILEINTSGNFTSAYSIDANLAVQSSAATMSAAAGVNIALSKALAGTVANLYGIKIDPLVNSGGTITNTFGIFVGDITAGTQTNQAYSMYLSDVNARTYIAGQTSIGVTTAVASAVVQIDSTTQGFLLPRMTTTQRNDISSPANGLMVYDTDLSQPCFYETTAGGRWNKISHSPA